MTESILRTAFENVRSHIYNLDVVRALVDELEKQNEPLDYSIDILEKRVVEVTLRTDIRILINECRHLQSKMTGR